MEIYKLMRQAFQLPKQKTRTEVSAKICKKNATLKDAEAEVALAPERTIYQ